MKDKKKRLLGIILTFALVVGMIPMMAMNAYAASDFEIKINSSNVGSNSSGTGTVGGTWDYDAATKTLTLNNYKGMAVELSGAPTFKIVLIGENKITNIAMAGAGNTYGIHSSKNLTLSGSGSLDIDLSTQASQDGISLIGIEANNLTISATGKLTINLPYSETAGFTGITASDKITLENADVEINGGNHAILDRGGNLGFVNISVKGSNLKINGADKGITSERSGVSFENSAVDIYTQDDCIQAGAKSADADISHGISVYSNRTIKLRSAGKRAVTIGQGEGAAESSYSVVVLDLLPGGTFTAQADASNNPQTVINAYIDIQTFTSCIEGEANPGLSNPYYPSACIYTAVNKKLRFGPRIEINAANFPDDNFRAYIASTEVDKDGDGFISGKELDIENMNVYKKNISSLEGIKYFEELRSLSCGSNNITTLDVSGNPSLDNLTCAINPLTSLYMNQNNKLKSIDADYCKLSSIDLSHCPELNFLYLKGNELTSLDVSNNTKLIDLNFEGNQLKTIDLASNTDLEKLKCGSNEIRELSVKHLTKLKELEFFMNQLVMLDLEGMGDFSWNGWNQQRNVTLTGNSLKFSELHPDFDKNKVSDIAGGYINSAGDAFIFTKGWLDYMYDTGITNSLGRPVYLKVALIPDKSDIYVSGAANGTAKADAFSGFKGQEVHLMSSPDEGYVFDKWVVTSPSTLSVTDDKFIMPGEKVSMQAHFKPITVASGEHFVTVHKEGFGTAAASLDAAASGTEVTLTSAPLEGYQFKEWQVIKPTGLAIKDNKFTMPDENVVVKAVFAELKTIIIEHDEKGTVEAPAGAIAGAEVILKPLAKPGYSFKNWTVYYPTAVTIADNKFTMPEQTVRIKANFGDAVAHYITVQAGENGSATSDVPMAKPHETVTLTPVPDSGYQFKEWQVIKPAGLVITNNKFTMPDEEVEVKAIFEIISSGGGGGGAVIIPPMGGIVLPPIEVSEEIKAAQEEATKAIEGALKSQTFTGEELKKAEEIKKNFKEKLAEATTLEDVSKLREEALNAINALWSDEELELKVKVEAVGKQQLIAKTKVTKTKGGKRAIRVSWTKVEGMDFDGFEIFKSTSKSKFSNSPVFTAKGNKSSYLNSKNLKKGKTYYYRVRAFKVINGEKVYTGWSTKTWKTPKK